MASARLSGTMTALARPRRLGAWALCAGLFCAGPAGLAAEAADSSKQSAGWWVETFGVLDAQDENPLVQRAHAVFERVAAASDKRASRYPRLVVVRDKPGPFALALPDGTVILTPDALELCYAPSVPRNVGDSRLAFVMGHELAHLASDDFWHMFVAGAVRNTRAGDLLRGALRGLVALNQRDLRLKELKADSDGIVFMTLAGYSPRVVLGEKRSFLEEWVAQLPPEGQEGNVPPRQRAQILAYKLADLVDATDYFHFGVRLYQLGRYEDAILLLEEFRDRFPSREVFNNLGLSRYQLAVRAATSECGREAVFHLMLPTRLDPETLAKTPVTRGRAACFEAPAVRRTLEEAVRDLTEAGQRDPWYVPSRINLASVQLLAGEGALALAASEEALKLAPEDEQALEARVLSLFVYGRHSGIETADRALSLLTDLRERAPDNPGVAYNLAAILEDRGRSAAARELFATFLLLEPRGPYADDVRRRLGIGTGAENVTVAANEPQPPIRLGVVQADTAAQLAGLRRRPFRRGRFGGTIYEGGSLLLLQLDRSIEVVEQSFSPATTLAALGAEGQAPRRDLAGRDGRTLLYDSHAFDLRDDAVVRQVYFSR